MKRLVLVAALVLVAGVGWRVYGGEETGTGALTLPGPAPSVGEAAEPFVEEGLYGEEFRITDDGVYALTFWSRLNRGAERARPEFADLTREYEDLGVSFAAVYVGSFPPYEDAPYAVLQDPTGRLSSLYNVKRVPRLFLIHDGRIALVQNGYYEGNDDLVRERLDEILAQENAAAKR